MGADMTNKNEGRNDFNTFFEFFKPVAKPVSILLPSWLADIGRTLKAARNKESQSELGKLIGVPRSVISSIENGQYNGSLKALIKYLNHYDFELVIRKKKRELPVLGDNSFLSDDNE